MDVDVVLVIALESVVLPIILARMVMMMMVVVMVMRVVFSILHDVVTAVRADDAIASSMTVQIGVVENAIIGVCCAVACARF